MAFFGNRQKKNEICFIRSPDKSVKSFRYFENARVLRVVEKFNSQSLSLFDEASSKYIFNIFEHIPRLFTITTNSESCQFNIEILTNASSVISKQLRDNPDNLSFHIDIKDEEKVLKKIESLFLGKTVIFDEDELPISHKITKALNLVNCPNFMKPESLKEPYESMPYIDSKNNRLSVEIDTENFNEFIKSPSLQTFVIKTKKRSYNCNKFGIYSSIVIRQIIERDPTTVIFEYDFDDEFNEFQLICDLFNFESIKMTKNNMETLKFLADDLKIIEIADVLNKYIGFSEKVSRTIDDKQKMINKIDDIFDLLYNIDEKTVGTVARAIVDSEWSKTIEKVQELAAFILQVIKSGFLLHNSILDLLIHLNGESSNTNKLEILLPFVSQQLILSSFKVSSGVPQLFERNEFDIDEDKRMTNYAFIYKLIKNGFIQKDEIISIFKNNRDFNEFNNPMTVWFLPEIYQIYPDILEKIRTYDPTKDDEYGDDDFNTSGLMQVTEKQFFDFQTIRSFFLSYLPDKIEQYEQLRDLDGPSDKLTKALRIDDVDTFQAMISNIEFDITKSYVPFNLFENLLSNGTINNINYAAAYGSLKCFKYLLLNHLTINKFTFEYAVYGGNVEIIKIIEQHQKFLDEDIERKFTKPKKKRFGNPRLFRNRYADTGNKITRSLGSTLYYKSNPFHQERIDLLNDEIIPSIILHKNDLFDWIFEHKLEVYNKKKNSLYPLLFCSVENGNSHSFIEVIENGCELKNYQIQDLIRSASKHGFYHIVQLLFDFIPDQFRVDDYPVESSVNFGNLSIFKLFVKCMNQGNFLNLLTTAIDRDYINIIHYYFETLAGNEFLITKESIYAPIKEAVCKKNNDIFNYLIENIEQKYPEILVNFTFYDQLVIEACKHKNIEAGKKLTDLILRDNSQKEFTNLFVFAADSDCIDLCKYFIDKKASINYKKISASVSELSSINEELFLLIESDSHDAKERIFDCIDEAISKKNQNLVEYLLKNDAPCVNGLIKAVETNDIDIVNLILKYRNKPSFINKKSPKGTALNIAVSNNNLSIVERLLSLPGINPSIYCSSNETPLIKAIINLNLEIINKIIAFYGNDNPDLKWQLEKAIDYILIHNENDSNKEKNKKSMILYRLLEIKCIDLNHHFDDFTLLTYACSVNDIDLVRYLLQFDSIDVNLYEPTKGNTPLIIAVQNNNFDIVKLLIETPKTDINMMNYYDQTALIIAVINHFDNLIDLLLNDDKFDPEESKLNYSFFISSGETSKRLIASAKSLDVNYKLSRHLKNNLTYENYMEHFKKDNLTKEKKETVVFYQPINKYGTALTNAVDDNNIDMIDLIINHSSFDKNKSLIDVAIAKAVYSNNVEIMRKLLELNNNDINIFDTDGNNLLKYAVMNENEEVLLELLNNENFDSKKFNLVQAFVDSYSIHNNDKNIIIDENTFSPINIQMEKILKDNDFINNNIANMKSPMNVMNILYNYDLQHDHLIDFSNLLSNGKSFFTSIYTQSEFVGDIVNFFLANGCDPNKPDKFNVYPLEYAINKNSNVFVMNLMNSNQIDYSVEICSTESVTLVTEYKYLLQSINREENKKIPNDVKGITFLHLAVISSSSILNQFLIRNVIDVNVKNSLSETPLIIACKNRKKDCIRMLFQEDDLDYLHKNNEGKNALDIIECVSLRMGNQSSDDIDQNDRNEFLNRLLSYV